MAERRPSDQEGRRSPYATKSPFPSPVGHPILAPLSRQDVHQRPGEQQSNSFANFSPHGSPGIYSSSPQQQQIHPQHHASRNPSTASNHYSILPPLSQNIQSSQSISVSSPSVQDLQQQLNAKSTELQALQAQHHEISEKIQQLQARCTSLEQKLDISDDEINALTEDNQRLQAQVSAYQIQVDELQRGREEARTQLAASGTQYMQIIDMSSRLQVQSVEDRKRWHIQKQELESRIKTLEEAIIVGSASAQQGHSLAGGPSSLQAQGSPDFQPSQTNSASKETIMLLHNEISRLRSQTETLELALRIAREENASIQAAATTITNAGRRFEEAIATLSSRSASG